MIVQDKIFTKYNFAECHHCTGISSLLYGTVLYNLLGDVWKIAHPSRSEDRDAGPERELIGFPETKH